MEYKGYTVTQSSLNNHIMISKEDKLIAHIKCYIKRSDEELREAVDSMLEARARVRKAYLSD